MAGMTVEIVGLDKLKANFDKAPVQVYKNLNTAIRKSALIISEAAKSEAPVKTARLRTSIRPTYSQLEARIAPHVKYALWVHEGTKPHIIRPKSKKALYWKGALHPVRLVRHPGSKGKPFMSDGLRKALPEVNQIFQQEVDKAVSAIANNK